MNFGSSYHLTQLFRYQHDIFVQSVIEVEDLMFPNYLEDVDVEKMKSSLQFFRGKKIFSGPFIDLNFATPENDVRNLTLNRFYKTYEIAQECNINEIVFLSNFIPIIHLKTYETSFVENSVLFWKEFLTKIDYPDITFSIGNTFEFTPELLVQIVQKVNHPQLKLTFDLGHFLVYSKITLEEWISLIKGYCSTVYLHSNDGKVDTHDHLFNGVLDPSHLTFLKENLLENVNYILKMNDKSEFTRNQIFFVR